MSGARDGQIRVRRGTDVPPWALQMFDDEVGIWLTLAQADVEEDVMREGIPVLRGPYTVNYTDIPHDGDTLTLWTPESGDVILRLFADAAVTTDLDSGQVSIGTAAIPNLLVESADFNQIGRGLDFYAAVLTTTDPIQIKLDTGADPSEGFLALYALVARAVAP